MAQTSKKPIKRAPRKVSKKQIPASKKTKTSQILRSSVRLQNYLKRRPHRSFQLTRRRDYRRSLKLPGYIVFTIEVLKILWLHKRTYFNVVIVFSLFTAMLVGIASQDTFSEIAKVLRDGSTNIFSGGSGEIIQAGLLLIAGIQGDFTQLPSEAQQIYAGTIFFITWLVVVWLLRAQLAGNKPSLRDALYSAGSPIISTAFVGIFFVIQLLPIGLAALVFDAIINTDIASTGVLAMIFSLAGMLLVILSLYLISSTFFALVIVTLPGMYPWKAIRAASDLVIGRRLRILLRLLWLALLIVIVWLVVMIPIVILSSLVQTSVTQIGWVPIVPIMFVVMSTVTMVLASAYVYLLYRKVVDDDSPPA